MGKLELSHFSASQQQTQQSRPRQRQRVDAEHAARFSSLVAENPFRQESRRGRRRGRNEDTRPDGSPNIQPQPEAQPRPHTSPQQQESRQFVSRQARLPHMDLKGDESFPELTNVQQRVGGGCWERAGVDIVTSTSSSRSPVVKADTEAVRPGWVRVSRNGIEYGPRSENYDRVLETQRRTAYIIHQEFFNRNKRIARDNLELYGEDETVFSDDEGYDDDDDGDDDAAYLSGDDGDTSKRNQYSDDES